jgi:hypothetical protein
MQKEEERLLFLFSTSSIAIYAAVCGCVRDSSDVRHFLELLLVVQPTRVFRSKSDRVRLKIPSRMVCAPGPSQPAAAAQPAFLRDPRQKLLPEVERGHA